MHSRKKKPAGKMEYYLPERLFDFPKLADGACKLIPAWMSCQIYPMPLDNIPPFVAAGAIKAEPEADTPEAEVNPDRASWYAR